MMDYWCNPSKSGLNEQVETNSPTASRETHAWQNSPSYTINAFTISKEFDTSHLSVEVTWAAVVVIHSFLEAIIPSCLRAQLCIYQVLGISAINVHTDSCCGRFPICSQAGLGYKLPDEIKQILMIRVCYTIIMHPLQWPISERLILEAAFTPWN